MTGTRRANEQPVLSRRFLALVVALAFSLGLARGAQAVPAVRIRAHVADLVQKPTPTARARAGVRKRRSASVRGSTRARRLTRADREVIEYARGIGIIGKKANPGKAQVVQLRKRILQREKRRAQELDRRNRPELIDRVNARFAAAQKIEPPPARVLFGFSRNIDKKFELDQHSLDAIAAGVNRGEVERLIARGPKRAGAIDSFEELVAAIAHHQLNGKARALQLSITPGLRADLDTKLNGVSVSTAVGAAPAFGANLAASYRNLDPAFTSAQTSSTEQAELFSPRVRLVTRKSGPAGRRHGKRGDPDSPTKVNYIVEMEPDQDLLLFGDVDKRRVGRARGRGKGRSRAGGDGDGRDSGIALKTFKKHGRIILSTPSTDKPTFDRRMGHKQLAALADANDIFVAAGLHYITGYSDKKAREVGNKLRWQLGVMRKANPKLFVHYQYVRAKDPAKEHLLFEAINGQVDSISLNAVELGELCANLEGHVLEPGKGPVVMPKFSRGKRVDPDNPRRIYKLASALMEATGIERVRVHGMKVDMTLVRDGSAERMEAEAMASHHARSVGANKAANRSGQVSKRRDRWEVLASVDPVGMAAMQSIADLFETRRALDSAERDRFITEGTYIAHRRGGISVAATPARQYYDLKGGLVSMGDTLDLSSLFSVGHALLTQGW